MKAATLFKGKRSYSHERLTSSCAGYACVKRGNMNKVISYYRVSTERQGASGLGLDAQKKTVEEFAKANGFMLIEEFVEIESGSKANRPLLQQALTACSQQQAMLLIARLDRLGRNVKLISTLLESPVPFKAVDYPNADKFLLHILAAVAEFEREQISKRTKAALNAAKDRGVELGKFGRDVLSVRNKQRADDFAMQMKPMIDKIRASGKQTLREITAELNRFNIPTYSIGHKWHLSSVYGVVSRIERLYANRA